MWIFSLGTANTLKLIGLYLYLMARLTKQQEAERFCVGLHVYCYKVEFEHFEVNASILAADQSSAEKILNKQYKGFKALTLIFISNRILL